MSKAHLPPVPPENQAPHGGGNTPGQGDVNPKEAKNTAANRGKYDPGQQGITGGTGINTHHQGYQQDR
ncbi:hypothetical protein J8J14_01290 [Roseomonas sp. SSH11]|uniref:Uncharacterized protein n=1 Tax=Pararoseomonas baculiformis TaxID=2820812 RepID=A0ABS4A8S3_9PROT|nr:hypothetical protein [Pararoseomonas baculiformis]MBP0443400.1 hypothetical protein [Pararoseomonas baculiformis]